jgi:two-component system NarL family sensor kinase
MLNLSQYKLAETQLRLLARQVVQSQEDERARLARELHDGTSQSLVSAKLMIESALDELAHRSGQPAPPMLPRALSCLNETLNEVRRISHRLRPALLDTLGLPAALAHLAREFEGHGAPAVHLAIEGEAVELPEDVNTVLFRVSQEALTNVAKHGRAQSVELVLRYVPDGGVQLDVADDGQGFEVEAVTQAPTGGIGLRNMRERLETLGGHFEIHSQPRAGTQVQARIPQPALARLRQSQAA